MSLTARAGSASGPNIKVHIREASWCAFIHSGSTRASKYVRRHGDLRFIQVPFSYSTTTPRTFAHGRYRPAALYMTSAVMQLLPGAGSSKVNGACDRSHGARSGVQDRTALRVLARFRPRAQLAFTVSTQSAKYQRVELVGLQGPHRDRKFRSRAAGRTLSLYAIDDAAHSTAPACARSRCRLPTSISCRPRRFRTQ